ncbi:uncharacterized protein LOC109845880 [Asparagus officinalis]|uniref:uncharacterized protein LOC109845880 n=1 Tax=Asparagus officinalis TaxID=4686 RepID=UPI00098E2A98|nr:uncharacterized protein LOC109845880 [Asparagus officinalis]
MKSFAMRSTVEDNSLQIEKFGSQNFRYWMMKIEDYLYQKDLFLRLQGVEGKPKKIDDDKWKVLDRKALAIIRLNLHQHMTYNVSHATTTKELMEALEVLYEKPSASNKVYLMKNLFNLKMQQGARVADFLNDLWCNSLLQWILSSTMRSKLFCYFLDYQIRGRIW